jgi:hypothetical protein
MSSTRILKDILNYGPEEEIERPFLERRNDDGGDENFRIQESVCTHLSVLCIGIVDMCV